MPAPDFLLSPAFRTRLPQLVQQAVVEARMRTYEPAIPRMLIRFLDTAGRRNYDLELRRSVPEQRGERFAVASLNALIGNAAGIGQKAGRDTILEVDVALAYVRKFCDFWPFC